MLCGRDLIYYYFSRFSPDASVHLFTSLPCPTDLKCYLDSVLDDYLYSDLFLGFLFCCIDRPVYFRALPQSLNFSVYFYIWKVQSYLVPSIAFFFLVS